MSHLVYPRLSGAAAEIAYIEVVNAYESGGIPELRKLSALAHPSASPVPTGGQVATPDHIRFVQESAESAVASWLDNGSVPLSAVHNFDVSLGRSLHDSLNIASGDAGHVETWNFLSLVVLPHVSVLRFPTMHRSRIFGRPRNSLRRSWLREEVLGDILVGNEDALGEDIMVGMFERSELARNRTLIRALARALIAYDGPVAKSKLARDFSKRITWATGPFMLDILSAEEIDDLVDEYLTLSLSSLS